jgi:hypothetical protein
MVEIENQILYEYNIVKLIHDNFNKIIKDEVIKVINYIINTINKTINLDLHFLSLLFFSNNTSEYGQIGIIHLQSIDELNNIIQQSNIRELFVILNNFRKNIDCFMFELLINYKNNPILFLDKYPYFNKNYLNYIINFIENLLDIDINELTHCYDSDFNIVTCDETHKKFYRAYEDLNTDQYKKNFYNGICALWCPFAIAVPNQSLIKLSYPNKIPDIVSKSFKKKVNLNSNCVNDMLVKFPLIERLSINEKTHLENNNKTTNNYNFSFFNLEQNELNFMTKLKKRYNKLAISYTSGHTIIMLMICKYFKNINFNLIILGCIIWLVPYNHSINEIFLAAKKIDVFNEYNYKISSFENVNNLIETIGLNRLDQVVVIGDKDKDKI